MPTTGISDFIEGYCAAFRPGGASAAAGYFHYPVTLLAGGTKQTFASSGDLEAMFVDGLAALSDKGFSHSTVDEMNIHPLGASVALASGVFTRWHENGSELEKIGATYTVIKEGAGDWKITTVITHGVETVVSL